MIIDSKTVVQVKEHRFLVITIDEFKWQLHVSNIMKNSIKEYLLNVTAEAVRQISDP